jgi:hypothetical protein
MSDIALNVALHYAGAMSGAAPPENLDKPCAELRPRASTGDFFGADRPSATD